MFISQTRYLMQHKKILLNPRFKTFLNLSSKSIETSNFNRCINLDNKNYFSSKKQKKSQIQLN